MIDELRAVAKLALHQKAAGVDADYVVGIVFAAIGLRLDDDGNHIYLSTSCLHENHEYCKSEIGILGLKKPAQCKTCATRCICLCHHGSHPNPEVLAAIKTAGILAGAVQSAETVVAASVVRSI